MLSTATIAEEILDLKQQRHAILLAHHYQAPEIQELADVIGDSLELARKAREFEGDVVLRLLIDADGSIAKVEIVSDPGQGLGPAAAQAVRELRFSPAKVNGVAVATTVPFTIHFTLD